MNATTTLAVQAYLKSERTDTLKRVVATAVERGGHMYNVIADVKQFLDDYLLACLEDGVACMTDVLVQEASKGVDTLWLAEWAVDAYAIEHELDRLKGRL